MRTGVKCKIDLRKDGIKEFHRPSEISQTDTVKRLHKLFQIQTSGKPMNDKFSRGRLNTAD